MSFNKKILSAMICAAVVMPGTASAYEIIGKKLEIYGKAHISVDASDDDNGTDETSISSNSTRLGFKGKHEINDNLSVVYKIEQEILFDQGEGTFASRNAYVGLKGGFGTVLAGKHDTPFKDVGGKWGMFGDTVADRRAILGAADGKGNTMNQRANNSIMYIGKFGKPVEFRAMYSTDGLDDSGGAIDAKDENLFSTSLVYKTKKLRLGVAYEDWDNLKGNGQVDGWRAAGTYDFGKVKAGLIYESIDSNDSALFNRDVWGVNAAFKVNKNTSLKAQYLVADDHDGESDSGANMASIGLFNKLDKQTTIYAAYTRTDNDSNAKFQGVDGGHGDEVKTVDGGTPQAFSAGLVFKF
ncbi:MAG: porin [Gammaproteobacteria bacterium]|nr:porin [Gammaproteobacteria bacterium]